MRTVEPSMINLGTLNCRGITNYKKKRDLVNDISKHQILCCAIQETHIKQSEITPVISDYDRQIYNIQTIED